MVKLVFNGVQTSGKRYANLAKQDPGRARQNRQATEGTNFLQPRTRILADLCTRVSLDKTLVLRVQGQAAAAGVVFSLYCHPGACVGLGSRKSNFPGALNDE